MSQAGFYFQHLLIQAVHAKEGLVLGCAFSKLIKDFGHLGLDALVS